MTTTTRKPEMAAAVPSVAEVQAALAALRAEHARTVQRASGTMETWTTKRESRAIVTGTGHVAHVMVDEPVLESEHIGALERIQAKRALPDLADRISLLEAQLEEARATAAVAARTQRAEAIRAGEQVVRAALPDLMRDVRATQARLQRFAAQLAQLDGAVGDQYFGHRAPAGLGEQLDAWLGGLAEAFPVERR